MSVMKALTHGSNVSDSRPLEKFSFFSDLDTIVRARQSKGHGWRTAPKHQVFIGALVLCAVLTVVYLILRCWKTIGVGTLSGNAQRLLAVGGTPDPQGACGGADGDGDPTSTRAEPPWMEPYDLSVHLKPFTEVATSTHAASPWMQPYDLSVHLDRFTGLTETLRACLQALGPLVDKVAHARLTVAFSSLVLQETSALSVLTTRHSEGALAGCMLSARSFITSTVNSLAGEGVESFLKKILDRHLSMFDFLCQNLGTSSLEAGERDGRLKVHAPVQEAALQTLVAAVQGIQPWQSHPTQLPQSMVEDLIKKLLCVRELRRGQILRDSLLFTMLVAGKKHAGDVQLFGDQELLEHRLLGPLTSGDEALAQLENALQSVGLESAALGQTKHLGGLVSYPPSADPSAGVSAGHRQSILLTAHDPAYQHAVMLYPPLSSEATRPPGDPVDAALTTPRQSYGFPVGLPREGVSTHTGKFYGVPMGAPPPTGSAGPSAPVAQVPGSAGTLPQTSSPGGPKQSVGTPPYGGAQPTGSHGHGAPAPRKKKKKGAKK
ncbi:hypothetical protein cyc_05930 [Cyclospora cayetanensis]|uniref:Uncharacterized protein n=1 Tax=Cyclospora cayetanensis TaxID=88456 RepID=A0A1D3D6J7_9EIME|nr:hypothetical protein cyc_05930 [Cyclospora cayetanensis]